MTWEEFHKQIPTQLQYAGRELTDIDCPECGKKIWRRTDIILTTYPAQYRYECDCGWTGTAFN